MKVVNIRKETCDVYIGRSKKQPHHFGNPFSHNPKWGIYLPDRATAVQAYEDWLLGNAWHEVEPDRRQWILNNMNKLKGKLGCFCKPLACHGDILIKLKQINN